MHSRTGPSNTCKICSREQSAAARLRRRGEDPRYLQRERDTKIQRLYGLTRDQYLAKLEEQDGSCGLCGAAFSDGDPPHVDHDHSCCPGKKSCGECVRRLLCRNCNLGLGYFGDNVDRLSQAIAYLQRSKP